MEVSLESDLTNKVVLLTGGTDGIGKAAAMNFAKRGAILTIVGRNKAKTETVVNELKLESGNPNIHFLICDLSRIKQVKQAAQEFKAKNQRLDILVNNAGATFPKPILSKDGYELTFTLNHLAYFEMTRELLDLFKKTPNSRIVSTSSAMQGKGNIDLSKIATDLKRWGPTAYADSKLANILFTKELQRRLEGTSAIANCFEPGSVVTQFGGFGSDQGFFLDMIYRLAKPFGRTPEEGADTLIWLATSDETRKFKGEFTGSRKIKVPKAQALDQNLAKELWSFSEKLCDEIINRAENV